MRERMVDQLDGDAIALVNEPGDFGVSTLDPCLNLRRAVAPVAIEARGHRLGEGRSSAGGNSVERTEHALDVRALIDFGDAVAGLERGCDAGEAARIDADPLQRFHE